MIVGIGHPDRGDDAVGRAVAARLQGRVPANVMVRSLDGEATALVACLADADCAIIVDAAVSGAKPGTVRRFDANSDGAPPAKPGVSTHGFGLAEALRLARALGQMPRQCIVYAIEASSFELGSKLAPALETAADEVADRILRDVAEDPPAPAKAEVQG